jgi:hypothetical protein
MDAAQLTGLLLVSMGMNVLLWGLLVTQINSNRDLRKWAAAWRDRAEAASQSDHSP